MCVCGRPPKHLFLCYVCMLKLKKNSYSYKPYLFFKKYAKIKRFNIYISNIVHLKGNAFLDVI